MMTFRSPLALLALAIAATSSEAAPQRWYPQPSYSYPTYQYPTYQQPAYQYPTYQPAVIPAGYAPVYGQPAIPAGYATNNVAAAPVVSTSGYTPAATAGYPGAGFAPAAFSAGGSDALDEVNAKRAARGLRPFMRDEGLTQGARACAAHRAQYGLFGHTSNDFGFLPPGTSAASAGCAAYPASYGWMSCCVYENYTYAGAAWAMGRDGKRYMHLFVR